MSVKDFTLLCSEDGKEFTWLEISSASHTFDAVRKIINVQSRFSIYLTRQIFNFQSKNVNIIFSVHASVRLCVRSNKFSNVPSIMFIRSSQGKNEGQIDVDRVVRRAAWNCFYIQRSHCRLWRAVRFLRQIILDNFGLYEKSSTSTIYSKTCDTL